MSGDPAPFNARRRWPFALFLITVLASLAVAADWWLTVPADPKPTYVGSESCARCHQAQVHHWQGSDHDLAMQRAVEPFVLGDFSGVNFEHQGVTSRMFRRDGAYIINTEGPDGTLQDFEIKYTFGVRPLQQYMVEFPDGRVQVLRISWDTQRKRWFSLAPPDVPNERILPGDPLHWTGVGQNWNHTCADCHSTDLNKNFDLATNSFHTTFAEINVACEACHGPGSTHVKLAEAKSLFWDRVQGYGLTSLKRPEHQKAQLEMCAKCHSRRGQIHGGFHAGQELLDYYDVSTLRESLYHPDGQIQDEVYEYGSFLQSKMYRKHVSCTDCHDPHTARVYFSDNQLCAKCHQPGKYDTPAHHHHQPGTKGANCVECHMPATTYMEVDPRRDHSLRIPRPDLSVQLGTPNACNRCHTKPLENATWAAEHVKNWFGPKRPDDPHYGPAIAAGRAAEPGAVTLLLAQLKRKSEDVGDIVRATVVELLGQYDDPKAQAAVRMALSDTSALVRVAAVRSFQPRTGEELVASLSPLLEDRIRLARISAARRLVVVPLALLSPAQSRALDAALHELRDAELMAADRAGAHLNLGNLYQQLASRAAQAHQSSRAKGFAQDAAEAFRTASQLEPYLAGPRSNLADLYEQTGGDGAEVRRLRDEELKLLERDARLLPDHAHVWHRLGSAQYLTGAMQEAQTSLERACQLEPTSYDYRLMLTLLYEKSELWSLAVESANTLLKLRPGDQTALELVRRLQSREQ